MSDLNALNLEPGEIVGGYTLISRLGSGAMGSVWRVRDDGGAYYAMKILRDSLAEESDDASSSGMPGSGASAEQDPNLKPDVTPRERLRREAMALKKVNHPGVCGIVDMELDDSLAFIVTELIEGRNLKDDVAVNGRYIGDDLERLARKLIEAVRAVHAVGIVHRDIKPTNVMVSASGPVLVDFGIAMGEGESHVTRTGLVMGTPGFIAPEIIEGAESDEATDWWSVASVLAFAATGAPVFGTKPMMAVLERAASGNANLTGLPAGTLAAFRSALNPDRTKRCTPEQLLQAIALDALNPTAWQGAQAGPFGAGAIVGGVAIVAGSTDGSDADEAMRPFGPSLSVAKATPDSDSGLNPGAESSAQTVPGTRGVAETHGIDRDNPRTIWRAQDDADIIRTEALAAGPPPPPTIMIMTTAAPAPAPAPASASHPADAYARSARTLVGRAGQAASPSPEPTEAPAGHIVAGTTPMPRPATPPSTTPIRPQPAQYDSSDPFNPQYGTAEPPFGTNDSRDANSYGPYSQYGQYGQSAPYAHPAQPQPYGQYATAPDAQPTVADPSIRPALQRMIDHTAQVSPTEALVQAQSAPNPSDIRRNAYLSIGTMPLWFIALPLAALTANLPVIALFFAAAMLWLMLTLACDASSQLDRESKRGGERKGSDSLVRAATLPWHLLKGLLLTLPRMALITVICAVGSAIAAMLLNLPVETAQLPIGPWSLPMPIFTDIPASASGLTLAGFMAAGWLVTVFGPQSATVRLGAGVLRGIRKGTALRKDGITAAGEALLTGAAQATAPTAHATPVIGPNGLPVVRPAPASSGNAESKGGRRDTVLFAIWLVVTVAMIAMPLAGNPIDWTPLV